MQPSIEVKMSIEMPPNAMEIDMNVPCSVKVRIHAIIMDKATLLDKGICAIECLCLRFLTFHYFFWVHNACTHMDFDLLYFLWMHLITTWSLAFHHTYLFECKCILCNFANLFARELGVVILYTNCCFLWMHSTQTHMDFDYFALFEWIWMCAHFATL